MTRSMSDGTRPEAETGEGESETWDRRPRRFGMPTMVVLIILVVVVPWAWLALWDYDHPAALPARRLSGAEAT
ncbi:hypothetical protein ACYOEI_38810, partial [Singulisphaera rosea]